MPSLGVHMHNHILRGIKRWYFENDLPWRGDFAGLHASADITSGNIGVEYVVANWKNVLISHSFHPSSDICQAYKQVADTEASEMMALSWRHDWSLQGNHTSRVLTSKRSSLSSWFLLGYGSAALNQAALDILSQKEFQEHACIVWTWYKASDFCHRQKTVIG